MLGTIPTFGWAPGPGEIVLLLVALVPVVILVLLAAHLLGPSRNRRSSRKGAAKGAFFPFLGPSHGGGADAGPGDSPDAGGGPGDGGGAGDGGGSGI